MQARMKNPASVVPDVMQGINAMVKAARKSSVPATTFELAHLRASQINGCSPCVVSGSLQARRAGETDERLFSVAVWRDAPYYTDAERAALSLAESMTRLSDSADPVPDAVWNEAADHFDEQELASLIIWIAMTNFFNRLNATTKQVAGSAW